VQVVARDGLHRVRLGPYRNRDEARAIADKVADARLRPTLRSPLRKRFPA
jgi:cell division protein FtsN